MDPILSPTAYDGFLLKRLAGYSKEQLKNHYFNYDFTFSYNYSDNLEIVEHFKKIVTQDNYAILKDRQAAQYLPLALRRLKYYLNCSANKALVEEIRALRIDILGRLSINNESDIKYVNQFFKNSRCDFFFSFLNLEKVYFFNNFDEYDRVAQALRDAETKFELASKTDLKKFIKSFDAIYLIYNSSVTIRPPPFYLLKAFYRYVVISNLSRLVDIPEVGPILKRFAVDFSKQPKYCLNDGDIYSSSLGHELGMPSVFEVAFTSYQTINEIKISQNWEKIFTTFFAGKKFIEAFLYDYFQKLRKCKNYDSKKLLNIPLHSPDTKIQSNYYSSESALELIIKHPGFNNRFPCAVFRIILDIYREVKKLSEYSSSMPAIPKSLRSAWSLNNLSKVADNHLNSIFDQLKTLEPKAIVELCKFVREKFPNDPDAFLLLTHLYKDLSKHEEFGSLIRNKKLILEAASKELPKLIIKAKELGNQQDLDFFINVMKSSSDYANWTMGMVFEDRTCSESIRLQILALYPNFTYELNLSAFRNISCDFLSTVVTSFPNITINYVSLEPSSYNDMVLTNSTGTETIHINETLFRKHFPKFEEFSADFHDQEFAFLKRWLPYILLPEHNNLPKNQYAKMNLIDWYNDLVCLEIFQATSIKEKLERFFELDDFRIDHPALSEFIEYAKSSPRWKITDFFVKTRFYRCLKDHLENSVFIKKDTKYYLSENWIKLYSLLCQTEDIGQFLFNLNYVNSGNYTFNYEKHRFSEILATTNLHQQYPELYFRLLSENPYLIHQELDFYTDRLCVLNKDALLRLVKYVRSRLSSKEAEDLPVLNGNETAFDVLKGIYRLYTKVNDLAFASELATILAEFNPINDQFKFYSLTENLAVSFQKGREEDFSLFMAKLVRYDKEAMKKFFQYFSESLVESFDLAAHILKSNANRNPMIPTHFRKVLAKKKDVWPKDFVSQEDLFEILKIQIAEVDLRKKFVLDLKLYPSLTVDQLTELIIFKKDLQFKNFPIIQCPLNDLYFTCEGDDRSFYMNSDVLKLKVPFFAGLLSDKFNSAGQKEIELSKEHFDFFVQWLPSILNSEMKLCDIDKSTDPKDLLIHCVNLLSTAQYFFLDDLVVEIDRIYYIHFDCSMKELELQACATALNNHFNRIWHKINPYFINLKNTRVYKLLESKGLLPTYNFSKNATCNIV